MMSVEDNFKAMGYERKENLFHSNTVAYVKGDIFFDNIIEFNIFDATVSFGTGVVANMVLLKIVEEKLQEYETKRKSLSDFIDDYFGWGENE